MKKILILTILTLSLSLSACNLTAKTNVVSDEPDSSAIESQEQFVTLFIGDKEYKFENENKADLTVYDVLQKIAEEENLELKTKQYGIGIFLESIGDKIGDKNMFWLYYLNDKAGTVSIDNQEVKNGDIIKFIFTDNNIFNQ
ncbi:DUF4430 domain-containing protein [Candidatus Falkowbacteria bacterium]|nr:DUF4430 domain-containing protein [Candidatus Falkowbacteria bacterium]